MQSRHLSRITGTARAARREHDRRDDRCDGLALEATPPQPAPAPSQRAEPPTAPPTSRRTDATVVYLTGAQSLDELHAHNPQHYARAMRIIEAADSLCQLRTPGTVFAKYDASFIECSRTTIYTSLPPQPASHLPPRRCRVHRHGRAQGAHRKACPSTLSRNIHIENEEPKTHVRSGRLR